MLSFETLREALWSHLRKMLGDSYNWTLIATFMNECIVQRFPGQLESYPVTVNADNSITLGSPVAVEQVFRPLAGISEALSRNRIADGNWLGAVPLDENLSEADKAKAGMRWAAVLIREGISANGRLYSGSVLERAVPLFEGIRAYWTHAAALAAEPNPLDQAGYFTGARYGLLESRGKGVGSVLATFVATDKRARERLAENAEAGVLDKMFGISINAAGRGEAIHHSGRAVYRVDEITEARSADLVADPAAGGRFLRLVAGMDPAEITDKELAMFETKLKHLREKHPTLAARLSATPTETEVDTLLLEAATPHAPAPAPAAPPAPIAEARPAPAPAPTAAPAQQFTEAEVADMRAALFESRVRVAMTGRTFGPLAALAERQIRALAVAGATPDTLAKESDALVAEAAKLTEAKPAGTGTGVIIETGVDVADKIQAGLDGFFMDQDVPIREGGAKVPRFRSIKEAYITITGDQRVTGQFREARAGLMRFQQFQEGMASGTLGNVLASSMNRSLIADYNAAGGAYSDDGRGWLWRAVPANDFRNRERTRMGGYANLSVVPQGQPYPAMSALTDEKATYALAKRGGTETLTFEMIRNDDVGVVAEIPRKMARSAKRTFYEFVYDFLITNAVIYDSVALFHSGSHANLGSTALSSSSYHDARIAMLTQTEKDSGKRVGLVLRHLILPPTLEQTAYDLFVRSTNNDPTFTQARAAAAIHVITHATDTNNWYACAGIDQSAQMEIGFLDGNENPEMFVADLPTQGSLFTSDKMDMKLRHIYAGAILEYRAFYGAIVA